MPLFQSTLSVITTTGGMLALATQLGGQMSSRTYRITEIVGTSPDGVDQAINNGISRASKTLRHLDWFEVTQIRGQVKDGGVEHYQVGMKIGFRLEDD
jgi:flavin-binding protein dodecin